jgi:aspartate racemase
MKQSKVIGIMGGMGPEATRDLFSNIIAATPANCDQEHLEVVIYNYPQVPDRTAHIVDGGPDPVPAMLNMARRLEKAGADFIIIPCMSAHYFLDRLQAESPLPILSAFEATAKAVGSHQGLTKVGLLATSGTVQGGRFARVLAEHGIQTMLPDEEHQAKVMQAIYGGIKSDPAGKRRDEFRGLLLEAVGWLLKQGAQGIIGGCTEIPLVLNQSHIAAPWFDTLDILARAAVAEAATS